MKMKEVAGRIQQKLDEKNISQAELARLIGMSKGHLNDIINCKPKPNGELKTIGSDYLLKIAQTFSVTTDWLLTGNESKIETQSADTVYENLCSRCSERLGITTERADVLLTLFYNHREQLLFLAKELSENPDLIDDGTLNDVLLWLLNKKKALLKAV